MSALNDQELVAACLQGKESAYALLVERYTPRLYRIAARICRHPEDAEDAVQETLLQAVRDLRKWKPTAPLEAWLVTITVRTAKKVDIRSNRIAARSDSLEQPLPDGRTRQVAGPLGVGDPAAAVSHAYVTVKLAGAVAALPEKYRTTISLRFEEGLSPKEIAEVLGIPERTVRTHLLRGLRMLKESVSELE